MVLQTIWFEIRWFCKPYGFANHLIRISHVMVFICGTEYIIWDTVLLLVIYVPLIVDFTHLRALDTLASLYICVFAFLAHFRR